MARVEVVMPQMGESITEGTIVKWHKKVGEKVRKDETLLEISTDKVDSEIPSPASGVVAEILMTEQTTVPVRTVIAYLEAEGAAAGAGAAPRPTEAPASKGAEPSVPKVAPVETRARGPAAQATLETRHQPAESAGAEGRFLSPLVMNIARAENVSMLELERIQGSGEGGRVTKKDILAYIEARKPGAVPAAPPRPTSPVKPGASAAPGAATVPSLQALTRPVDVPELRAKYPAPEHEILQMSNVLQRMSEHMVRTVHTSPHVFAIHEVDLTGMVRHRARHADEFEQREGIKLTYTPYVCEAVLEALKKYPLVNSSVEGDKIIKKNFINLGIAVASEHGLLVPVIKHAEEKNFLGLARAVNDLALRTRSKKLSPDEIQGGTFTISNYGVFGTMIGTPLISQPQVAILGTGKIAKRVVVRDDAIAIRSTAYFTLSFDHRLVDGALAGMFLEEITDRLEGIDEASGI